MRHIRIVMLTITVGMLAGCLKVTIRPEGGEPVSTAPTFDENQSFFLYGLVGTARVDVAKACNGKQATQIQTRQSFLNGFLGGLTFGLYSPRNVRIWCG